MDMDQGGTVASDERVDANDTHEGGDPYASRPWIASYPPGIPEELPGIPHASLGMLFEWTFKEYATKPAFSCLGKQLTYSELGERSREMGAYLLSLGLQKGDRVAVMMPNVLQYPVAISGILRAGLTVVNVNPLYTPRELEHQLKDSGAKAIVILENFAATFEKVRDRVPTKHIVLASMGDMLGVKGLVVNLVVRRVKKLVPAYNLNGAVKFNDALKKGASAPFNPHEAGHDDVAFLQYTGGTTGVSKGATLTHFNVLANTEQSAVWFSPALKASGDQAVFICALPLYHIFALTVNAMVGMRGGVNNVLIPNPRDIDAFVKELKNWRWQFFPGLNTLFNALLNNDEFRSLDFSGAVKAMGGGMAVQRPVAERWREVTGVSIVEGYGLSETSPVATGNRFDRDEFTGTIGLPLPGTDISIRDDDGHPVPLGEVGEICIRGPQVMAGYWQRPDETAKVMSDDNFFRSGDMGFMDEEGRTKIVDRKKDMILVSGFNVYPNEIEEVAASHPGVMEAAAVGVPDEKSGEVVKLFVVKKDQNLSEADVKSHCRENLTAYKCPKQIEFRDELPKTNVGKILRRELRG